MTDVKKWAVAFPGQGIQRPGMADALKDTPYWSYIQEAGEILGYDLATVLCEGPAEDLNTTPIAQPAILVTCYAYWEAVRGKVVSVIPELFLGHSLGEVTAFAAAGALSFADSVRLAAYRGRLMEEAFPSGGGMTALIGLSLDDAIKICGAASGEGWVQVANHNSPNQIVISGELAGLAEAGRCAKERGARRVIPLNVSGPFHSKLMAPAAEKLQEFLNEIEVKDITIPVLSNYSNTLVYKADEIRAELIGQLTNPVKFVDNIEYLSRLGIKSVIEVSPTAVLGPMTRRIDSELEFALATHEGM